MIMSSLSKNIIALLVIASFLMVAFFSLTTMTYDASGRMTSDCPFSGPGVFLCPQNLLAATAHHLTAYHAFFNVPIGASLTVALGALVLLALVLFSRSLDPPWPELLLLANQPDALSPVPLRDYRITSWLALLENSPTLRQST